MAQTREAFGKSRHVSRCGFGPVVKIWRARRLRVFRHALDVAAVQPKRHEADAYVSGTLSIAPLRFARSIASMTACTASADRPLARGCAPVARQVAKSSITA